MAGPITRSHVLGSGAIDPLAADHFIVELRIKDGEPALSEDASQWHRALRRMARLFIDREYEDRTSVSGSICRLYERTMDACLPDVGFVRNSTRLCVGLVLSVAVLLPITSASAARAQTPIITSISPSTVTVGGAGFTLTVNGTGFVNGSLVEVNGVARGTTFVSTTQLTAGILAVDIAAPGTDQITVFNQGVIGPGGGLSGQFPLAVTAPGAPPVLTSAAPGLTVQGAGRLQLTLQGANFRPGATAVISPPLAALGNSNGQTQATDVAVISVNRISATLMTAIISLSPGATLGLRGIDVLNADGTSTAAGLNGAAGTTQPLQISSANSIAAPVSVLNLVLLHPRDGTVVSLGGELYAEAVLSGAGTGSVIGQWLWDNRVVEQFAVNLVAGQSVTVRTRQALPTWFLGGHTV
ncbi:MAG: IPT/TIG domain-containing protein, partial [Terracidiphilus sp.]